ncbi:hypothetical protein HK102_002552 [Quaeritorhiza haematococci]|nr:hypothetical protein HK102_002552 [Quaeritorhiza haematococci]
MAGLKPSASAVPLLTSLDSENSLSSLALSPSTSTTGLTQLAHGDSSSASSSSSPQPSAPPSPKRASSSLVPSAPPHKPTPPPTPAARASKVTPPPINEPSPVKNATSSTEGTLKLNLAFAKHDNETVSTTSSPTTQTSSPITSSPTLESPRSPVLPGAPPKPIRTSIARRSIRDPSLQQRTSVPNVNRTNSLPKPPRKSLLVVTGDALTSSESAGNGKPQGQEEGVEGVADQERDGGRGVESAVLDGNTTDGLLPPVSPQQQSRSTPHSETSAQQHQQQHTLYGDAGNGVGSSSLDSTSFPSLRHVNGSNSKPATPPRPPPRPSLAAEAASSLGSGLSSFVSSGSESPATQRRRNRSFAAGRESDEGFGMTVWNTNTGASAGVGSGVGTETAPSEGFVPPPRQRRRRRRRHAHDDDSEEDDTASLNSVTRPVPGAPAMMVNHPAMARVRRNWVSYLLGHLGEISRASKLLLFVNAATTIAHLSSGAVVLAISWEQSCDQPLRLFIMVYLVRVLVSFPLLAFQHLHDPPHLPQPTTNNANNDSTAAQGAIAGSTPTANPTTSPTPPPGGWSAAHAIHAGAGIGGAAPPIGGMHP